MHLTGYSPINNKGRRACLATFISKSILAAPMSEPTPENLSKADNDIQQIRSRISSTREEPSHQASLMAGNLIHGPSDVPCLVESSTAHGDLLLWVTFSSIGVLKLSYFSSYVSNLVKNTQISPLPSPKLPDAPQNLPANPYGRHTQICFLPTKVKLGFQLVGSPKAGPISLLKPKYKRCNPKQNLLKLMSALKSFLSILSRFMCRLSKNIDRRHQLKRKSPVLLWKYKNSLRTLPLDSSRIISHEPKSLKKNGSMVSSLQTSWNNNEDPYHLNRDTKPLHHALKRKPPIVRTVISVLLADVLRCLAPLGSATNSVLDSSPTSSSLLTMTFTSSNASLVDEPSTTRVITCAKLFPNF